MKAGVQFTHLIEGWHSEESRSTGLYWRGKTTLSPSTVTKDPFEAVRVDQEDVGEHLAVLLNEFEPLIIHGYKGKWIVVGHGFEGEQHVPYPSEDQILEDLVVRLKDAPDLAYFLEQGRSDQLGMLHHGFGMWIRNHYNLWRAENPHTMKDYVPELRNGVDYSPRHPDQMSMRLIERLYQRLSNPSVTTTVSHLSGVGPVA